MSRSWVPFSAAALVTGALALMLGALLIPPGGDTASETLRMFNQKDHLWLTVAAMFGLSGIGLLLGLPCMLLLFPRRGQMVGLTAVAVMTVASAGLAGFAMLLVFLESLADADAINPEAFERATEGSSLDLVLFAWVVSFYLGEALVAIALLRARSVPRWIPALLLLHVAAVPVSLLLPRDADSWLIILTAIGFCGIAIHANREADRLSGLGSATFSSR